MRFALFAPLLLAVACSSGLPADPGETAPDAGAPAGVDAGEAPADAGDRLPDAGELLPDAGDTLPDAGDTLPDAGDTLPDAGPGERELPWTLGPSTPPAGWFDAPPECTSTDWLGKYFRYRQRFRGDGTAANPGFTTIGLGPGESLPAGLRHPGGDCATHWLASTCRQDRPENTNGFYLYGDTTVWVGWYLMALATEHAAFAKLGIDTTATASDLYFALQAFNRLDERAETVFGLPPARDGFFLRDDVPPEFTWRPGRPPGVRFPRADGLAGYGCMVSGGSCGTITTRDGYFTSQDQVIELLPGLALVAKLVPGGTVVNGVDLAHEAKEITHRMVNKLRVHDWKVVDPLGESPPNEWGGTALPYSNQIAKAANFITSNAFGISDYRDALSLAVGAPLTGAVDAVWLAQTRNNQAMVFALVTVTDEWDVDKLVRRAVDWPAHVFPMTNSVLYDRAGLPPGITEGEIEQMLSTAPCGGPCHESPGCEEVPGWKGEHRFKSPEDRDGDLNRYVGEYPGLDYMLLHNLYVLAKDGRYQHEFDPPVPCRKPPILPQLVDGTQGIGAVIDPFDPCLRREFARDFCGRSFVSWLDAALRGEATIRAGGGRLECSAASVCEIVPDDGRSGDAGDDLFLGRDGVDDDFDGLDGNDCLYGFGGNDTLTGSGGRDELHGGDGDDTVCGEHCFATDTFGDPDLLYGDDGHDELQGGPATDQLYGGPGNDHMTGDQGVDSLEGEAGDDDLDGGMGVDMLHGGEGDDTLRGGMEADRLRGGPGRDRLEGGLGDDHLEGGPGRDKLDGGLGDDRLNGGPDDDFLMGGAGDDTLWGEAGSDRLCGGCGEDRLDGGWEAGTDQCRARAANALLCFTDGTLHETQCESGASDSDCRDAAFDAW